MATRTAIHELALEASRWEAVIASARDAIVSIDRRGRITLFNRAAEETFGYEAREVIGKKVQMLMPPPYRDEHDGYIAAYEGTGLARAIGRIRYVKARRKSGEVFPIELAVSEARVGDDVVYSAIVRDVTARLRLEAERDEARYRADQNARLADIGAMTARIAHDFGNPLAGLSMTAQRILRRIERDPSAPVGTVREAAELIVETARHLDVLVHDFKAFAREQRLEIEALQPARLLDDLVAAWEGEALHRAITLERAQPAELPVFPGDREKLRRVFDNLVKNAFEAIDRGPALVRLGAAWLAPGRIVFTVEDSGPGVPHGLDVFGLFETTKPNGTGLGLPICRQIVLAHGGGIEWAARSPQGTVFRIELPAEA